MLLLGFTWDKNEEIIFEQNGKEIVILQLFKRNDRKNIGITADKNIKISRRKCEESVADGR